MYCFVINNQIYQFYNLKSLLAKATPIRSDSMGIYFTLHAKPGCTDAERNCISNIHQKGVSGSDAAKHLAYLLRKAFTLRMTGVNLKDDYVEKVRQDCHASENRYLPGISTS